MKTEKKGLENSLKTGNEIENSTEIAKHNLKTENEIEKQSQNLKTK